MKDWYLDFVNMNYRPSKSDLVCLFRIEPAKGITMKEAAGRVASESSAGTWTTLYNLPPRVKKIMATAFEIKGNMVKVAYPIDLWEPGNAPQLMSGIAGNIFGMKALQGLRLVDVSLPKDYLRHYKGPHYGIEGIRKILKVSKRPVTGAVPKPKIGYSAAEHAEIAFETWMGGFDLVKDDENLTSTSFNKFEERARLMLKMREKAERLTGEKKSALLNITGETRDMIRRAQFLHDLGWEFAMIDVVTCGNAAVQTMRDVCADLGLAIHAHRAMHAAFDRVDSHGITMLVLAKMMRMIGVDEIHIGTVVGKLVGKKQEVMDIQKEITSKSVSKSSELLDQNWGRIKPTLPVASGGLHPGIVPKVMDILGDNICLLVSGGIHGHPKGTRAGAKAAMQAIHANMDKISLNEYAKTHKELAQALEKWGTETPI
ncbi:type III ribulose-bisphosphate carboxylase [archaeon]|nr:MAG: type III ribulose-bisphosphate carboxylase [archaeon]